MSGVHHLNDIQGMLRTVNSCSLAHPVCQRLLHEHHSNSCIRALQHSAALVHRATAADTRTSWLSSAGLDICGAGQQVAAGASRRRVKYILVSAGAWAASRVLCACRYREQHVLHTCR